MAQYGYGAVDTASPARSGQFRTLAVAIAVCLTLAVAAILVVSFETSRPVVLDDSFEDPVSRY